MKIFNNEYSVKSYLLNNSDKSLRGIHIKDLSLWAIGDAEDYIHLTLLVPLFNEKYIDTELKPLQYMYEEMDKGNFILYFFEPYAEDKAEILKEEWSLQRCDYSFTDKDKSLMVGCNELNSVLKEIL